MQPTLAEIRMFGGNFAPRGWAFCHGQLLSIAQNQALFSLLGTIYGGDGRTTFALPDMRGRIAYGPGTGPGLSTYREGQRLGTETNTMTIQNMPSHNHTGQITGTPTLPVGGSANADDPSDAFLTTSSSDVYNSTPDAGATLGPVTNGLSVTIQNAGNSQAYNNIQPVQVVNFIIAIQGLFPSRS